jgi:hypothetical protein
MSDLRTDLTLMRDRAKRSGDLAGQQIAALWNAETKRYENPALLDALHTMVNDSLLIYLRAEHLLRDLDATETVTGGRIAPTVVKDANVMPKRSQIVSTKRPEFIYVTPSQCAHGRRFCEQCHEGENW